MSWAEEQDWFGLEDLALAAEEEANQAEEEANQAKKLIEQGYWLQNNGIAIPLINMELSHLINCIKMINDGRLNRVWALPYLKLELHTRM